MQIGAHGLYAGRHDIGKDRSNIILCRIPALTAPILAARQSCQLSTFEFPEVRRATKRSFSPSKKSMKDSPAAMWSEVFQVLFSQVSCSSMVRPSSLPERTGKPRENLRKQKSNGKRCAKLKRPQQMYNWHRLKLHIAAWHLSRNTPATFTAIRNAKVKLPCQEHVEANRIHS